VRVPGSGTVPESGGTSKVQGQQGDPFLPPFTSLLVGEMKDELEEDGEGYNVLLNKFALVRGHFLLVTKGPC
jgi:sulfate adenylyltransferase (ADP) / ATP adenylyltransferase